MLLLSKTEAGEVGVRLRSCFCSPIPCPAQNLPAVSGSGPLPCPALSLSLWLPECQTLLLLCLVLFLNWSWSFIFLLLKKCFNWYLREERLEGERRGNIDVKAKHRSPASCTPYQGSSPHATWTCALTRDRTGSLLVYGVMPNTLSHTGQGCSFIFSL